MIDHCIFIWTDFNGDGKADNITFMIKRIKIHTSNALKDTNYRFPGNYGVEKFLELFSGNTISLSRHVIWAAAALLLLFFFNNVSEMWQNGLFFLLIFGSASLVSQQRKITMHFV